MQFEFFTDEGFSKMKTCYLVGGGSTLIGFDFNRLKRKKVFSINESVFACKSEFFVTIDYSWLQTLKWKRPDYYNLFKANPANKIFIANTSHGSGLQYKDGYFIWNEKMVYDLSDFDTIIKSPNIRPFGSWNSFANGLNSGFCALQLAILLGFNRIYLLGYDLSIGTQTHYHNSYKNNADVLQVKLNQYLENFIYSIRDLKKVKLISCSEISPLNKLIEYKPLDSL